MAIASGLPAFASRSAAQTRCGDAGMSKRFTPPSIFDALTFWNHGYRNVTCTFGADALIDAVNDEAVESTGSLRLMNVETAAALRDMMKLTVSQGTATPTFHERRRNVLGNIEVAGKTGSLSNYKPFKDYSWFVGFAPADDPKIAVAAVVVNGPKWRIHAPYIAREALKAYLVGGPLGQPPVARVKHYKRRKKHG